MTQPNFDSFAHEQHMQTAIELAQEAADRGDEPFGSVLVRDDTVLMSDSNRVNSTTDIRRHPELHLAYRACEEYSPAAREEMIMYTSTEPCPMCAGGMATAGFGRIFYSVSSDTVATFTGATPTVRSREILGDSTDVVGGLLNDEGRQLHANYDW